MFLKNIWTWIFLKHNDHDANMTFLADTQTIAVEPLSRLFTGKYILSVVINNRTCPS